MDQRRMQLTGTFGQLGRLSRKRTGFSRKRTGLSR